MRIARRLRDLVGILEALYNVLDHENHEASNLDNSMGNLPTFERAGYVPGGVSSFVGR